MRGKFIVIEGADGAGKTYIREMIDSELREQFIVSREPGSLIGKTRVCEDIRKIIMEYDILPETEALLFAASRAEHIRDIEATLDEGFSVVSDRYVYSSMVYQGLTGGVGLGRVKQINNFAIEPDIIIFLDVSVMTAVERMKGRPDSNRMDEFFLKKSAEVIAAYRNIFKNTKAIIVDANRTKAEVWASVKSILEEK